MEKTIAPDKFFKNYRKGIQNFIKTGQGHYIDKTAELLYAFGVSFLKKAV